jgi:EmrB/QacA subfamily drug resistance transporter
VNNEQRSSGDLAEATLHLRGAYRVLAVVFIADLMDLLDSTIATLAGPSIRADLSGDDTTLQWVLASYTVAFALGLVTAGRLGDLVGRRRLFLVGMAGFTLSSLACGLAMNTGWLITSRALQGLFGSLMIPQGFALLTVVFPPEKLRQAFVPFGPVMASAAVGGPMLAGWLLQLNLFGSQWRTIFLINVPIGVAAWIFGWRCLPRHTGEDRDARLDLIGVSLLTLASGLLIIPLVEGRELGWPTWTYLMMVASVVTLALFIVSERRSAHPVITASLFEKRSFVVGLFIVSGFFAAQSGFLLAFNLLLQLGLGWTPLQSGLALVPWALGSAVGVGLAGAILVAKLGRTTLQLGLGSAAMGLIALCATIAHWNDHLTVATLTPALLAVGFGTGLVGVPIFEYVLGDATTAEVGTGSGMLNAVQQFASAIGFAALGTVFFSRANHRAPPAYDDAGVLVSALAAMLFVVTLVLVRLLPRQPRQTHS